MSEIDYGPLDLRCQGSPTTKQTKRAYRWFGEGFTWTCPLCGDQYVLVQGKGTKWGWELRVKGER